MSIKVLLVEDNPSVRRDLTHLLNHQPGITVACATADLHSAVQTAESQAADVAVMDLKLPLRCGNAAVRRLRKDLPSVKLILISFQADPSYVKAHFNDGVAGYVLKDCAYEELVEAVETVAGGGSFVSPQIEIGIP